MALKPVGVGSPDVHPQARTVDDGAFLGGGGLVPVRNLPERAATADADFIVIQAARPHAGRKDIVSIDCISLRAHVPVRRTGKRGV